MEQITAETLKAHKCNLDYKLVETKQNSKGFLVVFTVIIMGGFQTVINAKNLLQKLNPSEVCLSLTRLLSSSISWNQLYSTRVEQ